MSRVVLDSYAVLAFLRRERGWEKVRGLLAEAADDAVELHISAINLIEVNYTIRRRYPAATDALGTIDALPLIVASADRYLDQVIDLKTRHAISLGDCFAAALAMDLGCPVVTGDPEFKKLEGVVEVEWLGVVS